MEYHRKGRFRRGLRSHERKVETSMVTNANGYPSGSWSPVPDVQLVIVGHLGFGVDHTPKGSSRGLSGSAYACAKGVSVVDPRRTGLVARVGDDFDAAALRNLGVDLRGVRMVRGASASFEIIQYGDNLRYVDSQLGVADYPSTWPLPTAYQRARHFHLATMPLGQQHAWLRFLRTLPARPRVSVDMFESSASAEPQTARALCDAADFVFMNEEERRLLFADRPLPRCPLVVKRGPRGATYLDGRDRFDTDAPEVDAVDTTGAGEIFAGAMLSLLLDGYPALAALRHAAKVASAKVGEFGVDGTKLATAVRGILNP